MSRVSIEVHQRELWRSELEELNVSETFPQQLPRKQLREFFFIDNEMTQPINGAALMENKYHSFIRLIHFLLTETLSNSQEMSCTLSMRMLIINRKLPKWIFSFGPQIVRNMTEH